MPGNWSVLIRLGPVRYRFCVILIGVPLLSATIVGCSDQPPTSVAEVFADLDEDDVLAELNKLLHACESADGDELDAHLAVLAGALEQLRRHEVRVRSSHIQPWMGRATDNVSYTAVERFAELAARRRDVQAIESSFWTLAHRLGQHAGGTFTRAASTQGLLDHPLMLANHAPPRHVAGWVEPVALRHMPSSDDFVYLLRERSRPGKPVGAPGGASREWLIRFDGTSVSMVAEVFVGKPQSRMPRMASPAVSVYTESPSEVVVLREHGEVDVVSITDGQTARVVERAIRQQVVGSCFGFGRLALLLQASRAESLELRVYDTISWSVTATVKLPSRFPVRAIELLSRTEVAVATSGQVRVLTVPFAGGYEASRLATVSPIGQWADAQSIKGGALLYADHATFVFAVQADELGVAEVVRAPLHAAYHGAHIALFPGMDRAFLYGAAGALGDAIINSTNENVIETTLPFYARTAQAVPAPDGSVVVTLGEDGFLRVWEAPKAD